MLVEELPTWAVTVLTLDPYISNYYLKVAIVALKTRTKKTT